jgi:hypothetical protein
LPDNLPAAPAAPISARLGVAPSPTSSTLSRLLPRECAALADRGGDELQRILAECHAALRALEPAPPEAFARAYERLALHYPEGSLSAPEQKLVYADWRRLLGETPADVLNAAIDAFVMTPARFMPTPGQLAPHIETAYGLRRVLARRARDTLALIGAGPPTPARP